MFVVDLEFLLLQVVYLASETFHYHFYNRMKIMCRTFATEQWPDGIGRKVSKDLPLKVGAPACHVTDVHMHKVL